MLNPTIVKLLKEKRPNITESSVKTYECILRNLYKKVFGNIEWNEQTINDNPDKILEFLKTKPANIRKTILSALVVITSNPLYRVQMIDDIKEYNKEQAKQEKPPANKWVDKTEINETYTPLKKIATLLYKKKNKTPTDYQDIQNYIILSLFNGEYIPPRRSKDYVNFKIENINPATDNYMTKNKFVFNSYKTAKTYGQQEVEIPKSLKAIINKWIKINPTEYLLFDISFNPLSSVKLTQRLNKLFDKNVSVNSLRKSFMSSRYNNLIDIKQDMNKDFKMMGSSALQEHIYIKK